jgi:hypothetical protein
MENSGNKVDNGENLENNEKPSGDNEENRDY